MVQFDLSKNEQISIPKFCSEEETDCKWYTNHELYLFRRQRTVEVRQFLKQGCFNEKMNGKSQKNLLEWVTCSCDHETMKARFNLARHYACEESNTLVGFEHDLNGAKRLKRRVLQRLQDSLQYKDEQDKPKAFTAEYQKLTRESLDFAVCIATALAASIALDNLLLA